MGRVPDHRASIVESAHHTPVFGQVIYIAVTALVLNLVVSAVLTLAFRKIGLRDGYDETRPTDYTADPVPVPAAAAKTRTPAIPPTR